MPKIGPRRHTPRELPTSHEPGRLGEVSMGAREQNADSFLQRIEKFGWPEPWPERPEGLTFDDHQLWTAYRKADRGEKLGREEKEQLNLLGLWRSAVMGLEAHGAARLQTSIGVLTTLEALGRYEDVARVRTHIFAEFRCTLPDPAPPTYLEWTRRFCEHFSRNFVLCPIHLRRMTKPPEGAAYTRPSAPAAQQAMRYAEDE